MLRMFMKQLVVGTAFTVTADPYCNCNSMFVFLWYRVYRLNLCLSNVTGTLRGFRNQNQQTNQLKYRFNIENKKCS